MWKLNIYKFIVIHSHLFIYIDFFNQMYLKFYLWVINDKCLYLSEVKTHKIKSVIDMMNLIKLKYIYSHHST